MAHAFCCHDETKSLWSQAQESKKLHFIAQDKPSLVGQLSARDLSIIWGSDPRYWKWTDIKEGNGGDVVEEAELLEVCWLQIDGKYDTQKLTEGLKYEVQFVVMLKDTLNITTPVNLILTLPDGTKQETKQNLMEEPKNRIIGLTVGQFQAPKMCGDIKFSLMETGSAWKKGLVVIGALIVPKLL